MDRTLLRGGGGSCHHFLCSPDDGMTSAVRNIFRCVGGGEPMSPCSNNGHLGYV